MDSSNKAESVFHEQISRSEEKEQMNNHCAWFESQYGKNATVDRFMIIPTKTLSYEGDFFPASGPRQRTSGTRRYISGKWDVYTAASLRGEKRDRGLSERTGDALLY